MLLSLKSKSPGAQIIGERQTVVMSQATNNTSECNRTSLGYGGPFELGRCSSIPFF